MAQALDEVRKRVRLRLEDTGASTVWSDEEIDAGLAQALDDYSQRFPEERRAEVPVLQGDTSIDLPEGARSVKRVVDPAGHVVPPSAIPLRGTAGSEQSWEVWGARIEFTRALPSGTVEVQYTGPRELPDDGSDPVPALDGDASLLVLGAVTWCLEQRSVADWKRGSLPARYETVLRRAREEYRDAWLARHRQVRVGRLSGTG